MDELRDKVLTSTTGLEQLMKSIPGYEGYHNRERRRDADKLQRMFIADRLTKVKGSLTDLTAVLARSGHMEYLGEIDRAGKIFDKTIDRIRYADYGYAGFFDAVKINEAELDKIYEFDSALVNNAATAEEAVSALEGAVESNEGIKDKVKLVERAIKEMDRLFDDREKLIAGVA
ncbi:MAG: hypothetical protein RDV48_13670 [Candidatus Eremiobacteraeota bacterium]|nr:hypothetical protein [Candidatus Eremiobacteraeota bacterium]